MPCVKVRVRTELLHYMPVHNALITFSWGPRTKVVGDTCYGLLQPEKVIENYRPQNKHKNNCDAQNKSRKSFWACKKGLPSNALHDKMGHPIFLPLADAFSKTKKQVL